MSKLKVSTTIEADMKIWLIAMAREKGSSVADEIREALYQAKARENQKRIQVLDSRVGRVNRS